jgi:hypothetical protein
MAFRSDSMIRIRIRNNATGFALILSFTCVALACNSLLNTRDVVFEGDAGVALDATPSPGDGGAGSGDAMNDGSMACSPTPSLDADPKNCGRCGHDCLGATCTAGKCGRSDLSVTAGVISIARRENDIYIASNAQKKVSKVPRTGGAETDVGTCTNCFAVAVDDFAVYAGGRSFDSQPIVFPLDGSPSRTLGMHPFVSGLVALPAGVLAISEAGITLSSRDGVSNLVLSPASNGRIAADEMYAYYTSSTALFERVLLTGGTPELMGALPGDIIGGGVFVQGGRVFWTSPSRNVSGLVTSKKTDKSDQIIYAPGKSGLLPAAIAADATHVYWVTQGLGFGAGLSELHQCPLAGCAESTVIASGFSIGTSLVVDDVSVFVGHNDGVFRVAKP